MRVAFAVQRYGPEIRGGAEAHCRDLALRFAAKGVDVEVFTTCALDYRSWRNDLPAGTSSDGPVTVHRFPTTQERAPNFDEFCGTVLAEPEDVEIDVQEQWMDMQGPVTPALVDALDARSKDFDAIIFITYLYWTTYSGLRALRGRALLQPTAHDEAPIHLSMFDDAFERAKGFVFLTEEERSFVHRRFGLEGVPEFVAGIGVEAPAVTPVTDPRPSGLPSRYITCLGRVDASKGIEHLLEFFSTYRSRRAPDLELLLAGDIVAKWPEVEGVTMLGQVDDVKKWELLANADVLIHPSFYESFAMSLLEAWCVDTPALVNAYCDVTVGHCRRSGGGLWYRSYAEFEVALDRLLSDRELAKTLAAQGKRYVYNTYRWDDIIDRYLRFLDALTPVH